jgi:hypothetical protein
MNCVSGCSLKHLQTGVAGQEVKYPSNASEAAGDGGNLADE